MSNRKTIYFVLLNDGRGVALGCPEDQLRVGWDGDMSVEALYQTLGVLCVSGEYCHGGNISEDEYHRQAVKYTRDAIPKGIMPESVSGRDHAVQDSLASWLLGAGSFTQESLACWLFGVESFTPQRYWDN